MPIIAQTKLKAWTFLNMTRMSKRRRRRRSRKELWARRTTKTTWAWMLPRTCLRSRSRSVFRSSVRLRV